MCDESFPKSRRLRSRPEFDRVFDEGEVLKDDRIVMYRAPGKTEKTRLGIVVGRHVDGAVQRNRLERVIRAAFRTGKSEWPEGYDLIVIPRKIDSLTSDGVRESMKQLLLKENNEIS